MVVIVKIYYDAESEYGMKISELHGLIESLMNPSIRYDSADIRETLNAIVSEALEIRIQNDRCERAYYDGVMD